MPLPVFLQDVLFISIETVAETNTLKSLDQRKQDAWNNKILYQANQEEKSPEELYYEQAALYAEFGKIVTISIGYFHEVGKQKMELRVKSFSSDDEKKILEDFKNILMERFDQNKVRLCAHNGKEFDFPYLSRRMLIHCVPIPPVLNYAGKKPWEVPHLDTMEMWMFGNRKYNVSLDLLAAIFGIPANEPRIKGSDTNRIFYEENNVQTIIELGQKDVITTAQLFLKFHCRSALPNKNIVIVK